jgi:DNA mismatch repair protein MutS
MISIRDLHIYQEILPLFDFTINNFAKEELIRLLSEPLSCEEEILIRQNILKGLISHLDIFRDYSYSRCDLVEAYNFFFNYSNIKTSKTGFALQLLLSKKERHQIRSSYSQFILLLYKLQTAYFEMIDLEKFPESYKSELQNINDFLASFNLTYYEKLIRKNRIKVRHIIELTDLVSSKVSKDEHTLFWRQFFLFEAYLSVCKGIAKQGFSFPSFTSHDLSFEELYHPLIKQPVKNSFTINSNVILLTGPNMSGKSTFLKAAGLSVYLAHIGLAVSATKANMPYFESIFIAINLNDDILSGYSHFMSEVTNLKEVVSQASNGKKCFAVFDELFRGTNIEDAVEISTTTLKGLLQFKNSIFFISTHLHHLKDMEEIQLKKISSYCFDCDLINNSPVFSYQLKKGWSDLKIGQILFEKEGLNALLNQK